jgi:hypothetical protein
MTDKEAMKQMVKALEYCNRSDMKIVEDAITAGRQAIAEAEKQEPVAWIFKPNRELLWPHEIERKNSLELNEYVPLYTKAQPKQEQGEPVAFITPLMESQMFDDWCPYKGNPDPRVVWAAAIESANGLLLGAKQEQGQPVAWRVKVDVKLSDGEVSTTYQLRNTKLSEFDEPLYTTPQQRTWVGLSVFEINDLVENTEFDDYHGLVEAVEAKLKERNK